jgi:hypothetical protein
MERIAQTAGDRRAGNTSAISAKLEVTVTWICNVDPARCTCRYELDDDGLRYNIAFVAEDVYVIAAGIDKRHVLGVDVGLAVGIVAEVVGHRSFGDDDQAMPGMCVPTGASSRLPDVSLHVQI